VGPDHKQLVAPCAACYLNLKKTDQLMAEHPALNAKITECLAAGGLRYRPGRVEVRHLLDVIYTDVGQKTLLEKVVQPLDGLRVAPYYGCQVVRPMNGFDNPEYPMKMDELFQWLGAEVVDYPVKAHCCGGHMTQISEAQAYELIRRLLQSAQEYEADVILCMCPMCQLNMDAYQGAVNRYFNTNFQLPIVFFTQLLGVALGIDFAKLGFGKELVGAERVIRGKLSGAGAGAAK
jgi:heterodisulfide reductase subunit B